MRLMLRTGNLVHSVPVMEALLPGPSAGFVLEVFVIEGQPILDGNFGLVRIGPEHFFFTSSRWSGRASGYRRFHTAESPPRPDPCTRLRNFHLDLAEAARRSLGIISKCVLRPKLMSHGIDSLLKIANCREERLRTGFVGQPFEGEERVVDLLVGYERNLLVVETAVQVILFLAEAADDEHLRL